jgi:hypothetical protein
MTLTLFVALVGALALISSLVTEIIKTIIKDKPKASTLIVGIVSTVVGWGGAAAAYVLLKIPFADATNIVALILVAPACWLSATLGYDKFMEIITQIKKIIEAKNQ